MYSKEEIKILKKHYPLIGMRVKLFLPNRTVDSIDHEVRKQGIKFGLFEEGEEGYLDIETTNLNADFAYMLSYAIKTKGRKEVLSSVITKEEIFSGHFDKRLVSDCIRDMAKYKKLYTYYGTRFDIPFIRTRALAHNLEFFPFGLIQHQDLYFLVRNKFKLSRNRLDNICRVFGVTDKTHIEPKYWMLATIGDAKALEYILEHNIIDVAILEQAHNKIRIYAGVNRTSI